MARSAGSRNDVDFVLRSPEALTYGNDLVQQFVGASRALANGLLAVVTTVGGFNVMFRPYLGSSYASALELLPRLLLGTVLVNTAHWWAKLAIDVNNALCAVFGAGPPPTFADMLGRSMVPTELLIGLIYVVMGLLLAVQQLMRLAVDRRVAHPCTAGSRVLDSAANTGLGTSMGHIVRGHGIRANGPGPRTAD